jgi:hypothetical protein
MYDHSRWHWTEFLEVRRKSELQILSLIFAKVSLVLGYSFTA